MALVRNAGHQDAERIAEIYNGYVTGNICTFEVDPVSVEDISKRIALRTAKYGYLVAETSDRNLAGFAYYGSFRDRAAYDHVVETSIYLDPHMLGKGIGVTLYSALLDHAAERGFREAIGVLAVPNDASAALHKKLGFTHCGGLKHSGFKLGRYIDTAYWQKTL